MGLRCCSQAFSSCGERMDSLEAAQGAPRDTHRDSKGQRSSLLPSRRGLIPRVSRDFLLCWPTKVLSCIRDSRKSWRCALVTEGKRDPTKACVQDLMFMSRGDRNLGVAFQTHPGSPALFLPHPDQPPVWRAAWGLQEQRAQQPSSPSNVFLPTPAVGVKDNFCSGSSCVSEIGTSLVVVIDR